MNTNTLIAFCVGAMFLLAIVVVLGTFLDRRNNRDFLSALWEAHFVDEKPGTDTSTWPAVPKEGTR
jgi:hypothetical protein